MHVNVFASLADHTNPFSYVSVMFCMIICKSTHISGCDIPISIQITCLGFLFDVEMTFATHIRHLTGRSLYHLRQLRSLIRALTVEATRTLVHAFIISRVDYCNSVFGSTDADHRSSRSMPILAHNDRVQFLKLVILYDFRGKGRVYFFR